MISRQRFAIIILIAVLSMALTACVRPVPGSEDVSQELTPASVEQPNSGSGYPAPAVPAPSEPPADYPYPGAADTPRLDMGGSEAYPGAADPAAQPVDETPTEPEAGSVESEAATTDSETAAEDAAATDEASPDDTAVTDTETPPYIEHIVQPSQTLYSIGLVYGFSWVVLAQYNDIANPDALSPGDVVRIPTLAEIEAFYASETAAAETAVEESVTTPETEAETAVTEGTEYVVQAGDNLYRIALQFGLSWVDIAQANGLTDAGDIVEGQVLIIPANPTGE